MPSHGRLDGGIDSDKFTTRRNFLGASAAAGAFALSGCVEGNLAGGEGPIKLGAFEPRSGAQAIAGEPKYLAYQLAVDEINENGGLLDREVELVFEDNQTDTQRTQEVVRRLINREEVDVLMGGCTSSSREAARAITSKEQQLYFYNNLYEGGVCDTYTFLTGVVPSQQYDALVQTMIDNYGSNVYSLMPDYNFGQWSDLWLQKKVEEHGGTVLDSEFIPLDVSQYGSTINRLQENDPDWIMSLLVGENQSAFYEQQASAGLDIPMASSFHLAEAYEHKRFEPPSLENFHVPTNFMEEMKNVSDRAANFVDKFREENPDIEYVPDRAADVYNGMLLFQNAVEQAGTIDQDELINTMESGVAIEAPEGDIEMYGPTHHMDHHLRLARCTAEHEIEFIDDLGVQRADWLETERGCDLTSADDSEQYLPE